MRIGIIGLGIVGSACKFGFEKVGHTVVVHDIKFPDSSLSNVIGTEIVFICVPTPSNEDGSCDTSIVEQVVDDLMEYNYLGGIAIKSTVSPGTCARLIKKHPSLGHRLSFVPEFLRERCAITDFCEHHDVCIIGKPPGQRFYSGCLDIVALIQEAHGDLPRRFHVIPLLEAELVKYFNNAYNATLVTFANAFYELCNTVGADYATVKNAAVLRDHINYHYLTCNDNFRGFGGMCLPKDMRALASICKETGNDFFKKILEENAKYKTTVPEGMRDA